MTPEIQIEQQLKSDRLKVEKNFKRSLKTLFAIAVIGQILFATYIFAFYGGAAVDANWERINAQLGHGVIKGDPIGNFMLAIHVALAIVLMIGGPMQFVSSIRNNFPKIHRWNGRMYFITAFLVAGAGLYMNITRGAHGGVTGFLGNALNAVLIMVFSVTAWRMAMNRDFTSHKNWAIRAFLMVTGVWFFRVGYGLWILLTGFTAPGTSENLDGPFDIFLSFGHSIIPLIIFEGYLFVKNQPSLRVKRIGTASIWILSLLLIGGIGMMAMIFWLPAIS